TVSGAVLFLYDWMLMLPMELDVVWSEKLRPLNVLYIIQRYMPFVDTIGILFAGKDNKVFVESISVLSPCSGLLCETIVILTMRTWALWDKDIRLTVGLTIFFVGCWVPGFYIIQQWIDSQIYIPSPLPQIGCMTLGGGSILFLFWAILMVYKAGELMYMVRANYFNLILTGHDLAEIVRFPGVTYYLFIFGLSVANLATVLLLPHDLQNLFITYQRVIQTLLTSRVILHIRSQLHKPLTILLRDSPECLGGQRVPRFC
ncbi:hypothetical protein BDP27DRAFT_1219266, partial [Rhodocollybia butyracea]